MKCALRRRQKIPSTNSDPIHPFIGKNKFNFWRWWRIFISSSTTWFCFEVLVLFSWWMQIFQFVRGAAIIEFLTLKVDKKWLTKLPNNAQSESTLFQAEMDSFGVCEFLSSWKQGTADLSKKLTSRRAGNGFASLSRHHSPLNFAFTYPFTSTLITSHFLLHCVVEFFLWSPIEMINT